MARSRKSPAVRRHEILDQAWELFVRDGYEQTTVSAIVTALGISKGALYHHFPSKDSLVEGLAERMGAQAHAALSAVVEAPTEPAGPKLARFVATARALRLQQAPAVAQALRVLHRDDNLLLRNKIGARLAAWVSPLLAAILEQGVAEGVFEVDDCEGTAGLLWHLSALFSEQQIETLLGAAAPEEKVEELFRRATLTATAIERVLGARQAILPRPGRDELAHFVSAFQGGTS